MNRPKNIDEAVEKITKISYQNYELKKSLSSLLRSIDYKNNTITNNTIDSGELDKRVNNAKNIIETLQNYNIKYKNISYVYQGKINLLIFINIILLSIILVYLCIKIFI